MRAFGSYGLSRSKAPVATGGLHDSGDKDGSQAESVTVREWPPPDPPHAGGEHEEPSIAGALAVAGRFGIKAPAAKSILREVLTAVSAWRRTGGRLRLKGATLDAYASAFEHELMEEARSVLGK
jgi:hypothetical protein